MRSKEEIAKGGSQQCLQRWRGTEAVRKPPVTRFRVTGPLPISWGASVLSESYLRLFWLSCYGRRDGICEAYHWIVLSADKDGEWVQRVACQGSCVVGQLQV